MERFLSPAWFALVAKSQPDVSGDVDVVLEQRVTGTPDGTVTYQVTIANGRARIDEGSRAGADMTFTSDYATAAGIASGRLSLEAAMVAGSLRVAGNPALLQGSGAQLDGVDPLAAVRSLTRFELGPDDG